MPGNTSFYYAIFKRLQGAYYSGYGSTAGGHMDPNMPMGGFSLRSPNDMHGLFGKISAVNALPGLAGLPPLASTANPPDSPIYQMLSASTPMTGVPDSVLVGGQSWPTMPPPEGGVEDDPLWLEFNNAMPPQLVTALGNWIMAGKPDDTPKVAPLLAEPGGPPAFPNAQSVILFAASFPGDDGRRHGDGDANDPGPNYVPQNFWATSPIALLNDQGQLPMPPPMTLGPGEEFYVCALVGNSGANGTAGRATAPAGIPMIVICDTLCFSTFMSPAFPLPSFSNFNPSDLSPNYEQYCLPPLSYDVVAFRFNVDNVFAGLAAGLQGYDLGTLTPAEWLQAGHPCVKVLVTSGEYGNPFPPAGNVPLTVISNPAVDRHIAQHNLQPFDMTVMAIRPPIWIKFIASQAGPGPNALQVRYPGWPVEATRFYFGVPSRPFERYVKPGGYRGFEVVRDGIPKPFPDCVILRQTTPGARLEIADHDLGQTRHHHGPDRFFGMAIGVEADPRQLSGHRLGDIEVVHMVRDGVVVGGFSLRPVEGPR